MTPRQQAHAFLTEYNPKLTPAQSEEIWNLLEDGSLVQRVLQKRDRLDSLVEQGSIWIVSGTGIAGVTVANIFRGEVTVPGLLISSGLLLLTIYVLSKDLGEVKRIERQIKQIFPS